MTDTEEFIRQLANVMERLPVITPVDPNPPYGELPIVEIEFHALWDAYRALPEAVRSALASEWADLRTLMDDANAVHFTAHDLYARCAARLGMLDYGFDDAVTPVHASGTRRRPRLSLIPEEPITADMIWHSARWFAGPDVARESR